MHKVRDLEQEKENDFDFWMQRRLYALSAQQYSRKAERCTDRHNQKDPKYSLSSFAWMDDADQEAGEK